ncbi:MAG: hypothetical protein R2911_35275 [Caldilineaceae bacterium]
MDIQKAISLAIELRSLYEQLEEQTYGRSWTTEEIALGFMGDVGDLAKLIQASQGVRQIADAEEKLAHELSDCLWCIFVLADKLGVNIEAAYSTSMAVLMQDVRRKLDGYSE